MLFRFAVLVAAIALLVIASGAIVTSEHEAAGTAQGTQVESLAGAQLHRMLGLGFSGLVLVLAVGAWLGGGTALRALSVIAVVAGGEDAWTALGTLEPGRAALHAWLAPVLFSTLVAMALFCSPGWEKTLGHIDDRGLRFLRPLATATPPIVLLQIVLGALYRHKLSSVMWHMAGAMVAALATLIASMVVFQQYPEHRALRRSAIALMTVVLLQVTLGVSAFTMQLLETENTLALEISTASHVVVGSLTLAASVVFSILVRRALDRA